MQEFENNSYTDPAWNQTVEILGELWEIRTCSIKDDNRINEYTGGCCDKSTKEIIVNDLSHVSDDDPAALRNQEPIRDVFMRRELIHAFLSESGLQSNSSWAENEEMVDWFAMQFPKMVTVFKKIGCL